MLGKIGMKTQSGLRQSETASRAGFLHSLSAHPLSAAMRMVTVAGFLLSTLLPPIQPAFAQTITDPAAPIQFRPTIKSSGNGTPVIDIVKPGETGISHNKFREYNIDTRGQILNNSGLGGTSLIGGAVAPNPNLTGGPSAKTIVNEVTGPSRTVLNGPAEVFGPKADVIIANPNGVGCAGCGFINTGIATLSTGVPIVNHGAGTVGFETRKGDIAISGEGVSAPHGHRPEGVNLIGRTITLDGAVRTPGALSIRAGASRSERQDGPAMPLADAPAIAARQAITSSANGVLAARSIGILSTDIGLGISLAGNLQAFGKRNADGTLTPDHVMIVSAGDIALLSGESFGNISLKAAQQLTLARDLLANGQIAITARDVSLLAQSGVQASLGVSFVTTGDLSSRATIKSGADIALQSGGNLTVTGLIAAAKAINMAARQRLGGDQATLVSAQLNLSAGMLDFSRSWLMPTVSGLLSATDITLGTETFFRPEAKVSVEAARRLTLSTLIDDRKNPHLALKMRELVVTQAGVLAQDNLSLAIDLIDNAGMLHGRNSAKLGAASLINQSGGVIGGDNVTVQSGGNLVNLGKMVSRTTLDIMAADTVFQRGGIESSVLTLKANHYIADSAAARLAAHNARLIISNSLVNSGLIGAVDRLSITSGGPVTQNATGKMVVEGGTFDLSTHQALVNFGLVLARGKATINAASLLNKASAILQGSDLTMMLTGGVVNDGQILAVRASLSAGGDAINNSVIEARDTLTLRAVNYNANTSAARLAALNAELILTGNLNNLGVIAAQQNLQATVSGTLANHATVQSGRDMQLVAGAVNNAGAAALIAADGHIILKSSSAIDNHVGSIIAKGKMSLEAAGQLTNSSGRIETGSDMSLLANVILNQSAPGVGRQKVDYSRLESALLDFLGGRKRCGTFGWNICYTAEPRLTRDEYSGSYEYDRPGMLRSGAHLSIKSSHVKNMDGRILAVGNLSMNTNELFNNALTYRIDHYRHRWSNYDLNSGGEHLMAFNAPLGAGWVVKNYNDQAFKKAELKALSKDGDVALIISKGKSPVNFRFGADPRYASTSFNLAKMRMIENVDPASILDLAALGIDPKNVPDVIVIADRQAELGSWPYRFREKKHIGPASIANPSLILAGETLDIRAPSTTNLGTLKGKQVSIEGGTLQNGLPALTGPGQMASAPPVRFVIDDVRTPTLDLGPLNALSSFSVNPADFGQLERLTGSKEAATLLGRTQHYNGTSISFFADPIKEAAAIAHAAQTATGRRLVIEDAKDEREQRRKLYANALDFADRTGARFGVALTEAQRAALTKPLVWHEAIIVNGREVLVPRLYLPAADTLLRGSRGAGLIEADAGLGINLKQELNNRGAILSRGFASIRASSVLNERAVDLSTDDRSRMGGRGDSGLISAGTLMLSTDRDLLNRGGALVSSGKMVLNIGGDLRNETIKLSRRVDAFDGCTGRACGREGGTEWIVAKINSGRDLTMVAGHDLINTGGQIGAVGDATLVAGNTIRMQTLKETFLQQSVHQRGFLSGFNHVEHAATTAEASVQSLFGGLTMAAGQAVCDGGALCAKPGAQGHVDLNGVLAQAFGAVRIEASGAITMGAVAKEVHNHSSSWGFQGLGWGSRNRRWNDFDTTTTRISGHDVALIAKGPITGTGAKIAAVNDLLMKSDADIRMQALQNGRYDVEKGFYIGLTFPGSAGIDAALRGGDAKSILTGLAAMNPSTQALARLATADNGVAAALAAMDLGGRGINMFGGPASQFSKLGLNGGDGGFAKALADKLNPAQLGNVFKRDNFGLTLSVWQSSKHWSESARTELSAGHDAVLKAGMDVVLDQGTQLVARRDIAVTAGRDIILNALKDYARDQSRSWGLSLSPTAVGFDVSRSRGSDETLTPARIAGGGFVSTQSGRDTRLNGGQITGERVKVDVGRDLAVITPQAKGYREGFSFGLTIGFNTLGIRGSVEDGRKAWSSPSAIVGSKGLDIRVGGETTLKAALLQASDGDVTLKTGKLTVQADNTDVDRYSKTGGSITLGLPQAGGATLDGFGFSHEQRNKSGDTRTTVAGKKIEVEVEGLSREETAKVVAALNKDPATFQRVLEDSRFKVSGEVDVKMLKEVPENLKAIINYTRAQNAIIDDATKAKGPEAVDYVRRLIAQGYSPAETKLLLDTPEVKRWISVQRNWNDVISRYGSEANVPRNVKTMIAAGYKVAIKDGKPDFQLDCSIYGDGCSLRFPNRSPIDVVNDAERKIRALIPQIEELQKQGAQANRMKLASLTADLQAQMSYYALCSDDAGALRASGLIPSHMGLDRFVTIAEAFRKGGDELAIAQGVYRGDGKLMSVADAVAQLRIAEAINVGKYLDAAYSIASTQYIKIDSINEQTRKNALRSLGAGLARQYEEMAGNLHREGGYFTDSGRKSWQKAKFIQGMADVISIAATNNLTAADFAEIRWGAQSSAGRFYYTDALMDIVMAAASGGFGGIRPNATGALDSKTVQKIHHIFNQPKHDLDVLVAKFGSKEIAYFELEKAAQKALKDGRINFSANGVNTSTIVDVSGVKVELIGGKIINGKFELGTASRRDLK